MAVAIHHGERRTMSAFGISHFGHQPFRPQIHIGPAAQPRLDENYRPRASETDY